MSGRWVSLGVFLLLVVAASAASALFDAGEWYYRALVKPAWSPPAWFFGPAGALVYLFTALAAWRLWLGGQPGRSRALSFWGLLLLLHLAWSWLYFGLHRPGWAWAALGVTLVLAFYCLLAFRRLSGRAAGLMLPLFAWTLFLWFLNLSTWTLSGGPLQHFL